LQTRVDDGKNQSRSLHVGIDAKSRGIDDALSSMVIVLPLELQL
jgi:hypothetical protein